MINEYTIPVQFNVKQDPGAWLRYHSFWTPTIILHDVEDVEYRRSVGSLNAEQFLAELALGYGLRWFNSGQFERSVEELEKALKHTQAWPMRHAENLYYLAAARYEATEDVKLLMSTWQELQAKYPGTEWDLKTRQLLID
ncbi:MAG: hypothetical protein ACYC64_01595 [Armatimonadota bacterium]